MTSRIGVLLSGAGVMDGSEIHEATLTLYFLDKAKAEITCLAPDGDQAHVIDHQLGTPASGSRNMLSESARISRGNITPLSDVNIKDLDALILPGGFGAAKNLCDYAVKGRDACIREDVGNLIMSMVKAGKPVGAMCIAPVVVALALKGSSYKPYLTIGNDETIMADIAAFGSKHVSAGVNAIVMDEDLKIVSTPAYMVGTGIADIAGGIEKLVNQVLSWL
ncbi:isoprenoid biosynthesis glyoxalase ElbB [bacterium]|nr:isoprenoid biosynthesis glyoxalase ElbB [bacterium]